ncbi:hypothetical protein JF66_04070 [Cryobacterium sp. MLB-32]|uniref:DUF1345 domain-containing protein n=1 Tax=Cryobacterium sp. MLB-32 TaxID=1529318 RepID=UPI0004E62677|nr:DUF1345 domain-containing protein [Cryobacterium sp. MLB-32]KFF60529.1 hypothetical protein JF66_04070 [Cryobacterium sp. MLB-32]
MKSPGPVRHIHRSSTRLLAMLVVGVAAALVTGLLNAWLFSLIIGWAAACVTYITWVWLAVRRLDASGTARHATREDPSRRVSELLVLLASLGSLGAIAFLLTAASTSTLSQKGGLAAIAVASVALSWALIHTLYTLRYASLYYRGVDGGIDFARQEAPNYGDFAYLAFTIGMTYQVSDTPIQTHAIRMTALRHALLSFPFGAGILAALINLVAGLLP